MEFKQVFGEIKHFRYIKWNNKNFRYNLAIKKVMSYKKYGQQV